MAHKIKKLLLNRPTLSIPSERSEFQAQSTWQDQSWLQAGIAFWHMDAEHNLNFSNNFASRLLGQHDKTRFSLDDILAVMTAKERREFLQQMRQFDANLETMHEYHLTLNLDGKNHFLLLLSMVEYDSAGKALSRSGLIRDETTEKKLMEQLERTRIIANTGAYIFDIEHDLYYCEQSLGLLLFSKKMSFRLNRDKFLNLIHHEDRPAFSNTQKLCYSNHEPSYITEFRYVDRTKENTTRYFKVYSSVVYDPQGNPVQEQGLIMDQSQIVEREMLNNRQLDLLNRVSANVNSADQADFFPKFITEIAHALEAEVVVLLTQDDSSTPLLKEYCHYSTIELKTPTLADIQKNFMTAQLLADPTKEFVIIPENFYDRETDVPYQYPSASGYAAIKLKDPTNQLIGLLIILTSKPLMELELVYYLLRAFSIRLSGELVRLETLEKLQQNIQALHIAANCANLIYWTYSPLIDQYEFHIANLDVLDQPDTSRSTLNTDEWLKLLHPEDRSSFVNQMIGIKEGHTNHIDVTCRYFSKRKDWLWIHLQGEKTESLGQQNHHIIGYLVIIDALKRTEQKAIENANRLRLALHAGTMGTFDVDIKSMTMNVDETWKKVFEIQPPYNLVTTRDILWFENVIPEDQRQLQQFFYDLSEGKSGIFAVEFRFSPQKNFKDDLKWLRMQTHIVERDPSSKPVRAIGFVQEITNSKLYQESLEWFANHDELTGLPNARAMEKECYQYADTVVVLILVSITQLTVINQTYGHHAGNQYLQYLGNTIHRLLPSSAYMARQEGGHFAILVPESKDDDNQPERIARKVMNKVNTPYVHEGKFPILSPLCIGIAKGTGKDFQQILKNAHTALQEAQLKIPGLALRIKHYDHILEEKEKNTSSLIKTLQEFMGSDEHWQLVYQPIINVNEQCLIGFEALLRLTTPDGIISPTTFLPAAVEAGLILPIRETVFRKLKEAIISLTQTNQIQWKNIWFSINLTPEQLLFNDLPSRLSQFFTETQLEPSNLILEVTDAIYRHDLQQSITVMESIRKLGIRFALDDFGSDLSILTKPENLEFDIIKISQKLMQNILVDNKNRVAADVALTLGQKFGKETILEGIETREQYELIIDMGGNLIQGYYLARPIAQDQLLDFIHEYQEKSERRLSGE